MDIVGDYWAIKGMKYGYMLMHVVQMSPQNMLSEKLDVKAPILYDFIDMR